MKITIKSLVASIESQEVDINENDLVSSLYEKLKEENLTFVYTTEKDLKASMRLTSDKTQLFQKIVFLDDKKTFADYSVKENGIITVTKRVEKAEKPEVKPPTVDLQQMKATFERKEH